MTTIELAINGSTDAAARYLGWTPSPATARIVDGAPGGGADVAVRIESPAGAGGRCWFVSSRAAQPQETLQLVLPANGAAVEFWLSGRQPSVADRDASVVIFAADDNQQLLHVNCMVRIRKDAEALTPDERSRFLHALHALNNDGAGPYQSFCDSHVEASLAEAHGLDGFLPWHRAYLLDLERQLQAIDLSVALPYWRFNRPAPTLFSPDFLGQSNSGGQQVVLAASNPLRTFSVRSQPFIARVPLFDAAAEPAGIPDQPLNTEDLVERFSGTYKAWRPPVEGNPHGLAHVSFQGPISNPATAPRDPLFFLLHTNVDRLWARWQWLNRRFDPTKTSAFPNQRAQQARIGHNIPDTLWPWNAVTTPPRPPTAPRTPFTASGVVAAPGKKPTVGSMIDYQGRIEPDNRLGFDYDDVPFDVFN
jgi:tyrosinase